VLDVALQRFEAAFAPGPDLGGDQVHDGNLAFVQMREEAEVEVRAVGEDREVGLFAVDGRV